MTTFTFGQVAPIQLELPTDFPVLVESAEGWADFRPIKRRLASHFNLTDFGVDKTGQDEYILFPLDKEPKSADSTGEFKEFLDSFAVLGELSPKAKELYELFSQHKLKYADSEEFLRASKLGFLRLTSQLVVLRREVMKAQAFSAILNTKAIPISSMGDLEGSDKTASLKEALDFITQQALVLTGAQRYYDDLLDFWNEEVTGDEKRARDQTGAAPFWAAQKEKFLSFSHDLSTWPEFGRANLHTQPKKDSLLWLGKEAITDSKVKSQERKMAIKKAYHLEFKQQAKHLSLCQDATKYADKPLQKRRRPDSAAPPTVPEAPRPTASMPPTLSAPRSAFSAVRGFPSKQKNRRRPRPGLRTFQSRPRRQGPLRCGRCGKQGHETKNCHSR